MPQRKISQAEAFAVNASTEGRPYYESAEQFRSLISAAVKKKPLAVGMWGQLEPTPEVQKDGVAPPPRRRRQDRLFGTLL